MTPNHARHAAWGAALLTTFVPTIALALDGEITSDSVGQFYDVRSPTGETNLERQRFTTTLGIAGYNLLNTPPDHPKAPDLSLRARVRYDADYGATEASADPAQTNSFVPGYSRGLVDVMYAYIEGRRIAGGLLGFKLGRQYVTDVLGWWAFDGGEVSVSTPYYVKAEIYGGLEERGGMALSTSRFEADGIWRGDRSDPAYAPRQQTPGGPLVNNLYPSFQPAATAPAIGVALETTGVTWLHARLTYRRVYDTDQSNTTQFANGLTQPVTYDGSRISAERLGYAVDAVWRTVGGVKAGIVYDFYRAEVTSAYGSFDVFAGPHATISADYDYYQPWFDGDSIWNFFAGSPYSTAGLRGNVNLGDHFSVAANAHLRIFTIATTAINTNPSLSSFQTGGFPSNAHPLDEGGNLAVRYRTGETRIGLQGSADFGDEGNREGADLSGDHVFETRYVVGGRVGLWHWQDDLRAQRETTSFQYVANVGYRFLPRCQGGVEWEHDINGLVGQRFRLLLTLNLAAGR